MVLTDQQLKGYMHFINTLQPCACVLSVSQEVHAKFIHNDKHANKSKTTKSYSTVILLMTVQCSDSIFQYFYIITLYLICGLSWLTKIGDVLRYMLKVARNEVYMDYLLW